MGNELELVKKLSQLKPLTNFKPVGMGLGFEYWSGAEGEYKDAYFAGFTTRRVPSAQDPNVTVELEHAVWIEVADDGTMKAYGNASSEMLSKCRDHNAQMFEPFRVEFLGKTKNKNNPYFHSSWEIRRMAEVVDDE